MVSTFMPDDEEPKTQVITHAPCTSDAIAHETPAITPRDPFIHERPTLPGTFARDTVVNEPPSFFARACDWLKNIATAFQRSSLSDYLPPVPLPATEERAEAMLLEIMRAPAEYVDAAILIARATQALRKRGDDVFAEGFVVFALSRIPADDDGTVSIKRLRERVREMPVARTLMPVLLRLEEQGVIAMEMPPENVSPSGVMQMDRARVRLLVVP